MAKALKVVGAVVAVVAVVATAGAALLPAGAVLSAGGLSGVAIGAGGLFGISAATLSTIGTIAGLAAAGIAAASSLFMPKPSFTTEGNPLNFQTNPQSGLPYAMGRTRLSGLRIHAETYDATAYKSEGKDDVLSFAVMLSAGGAIDAIEDFSIDNETVAFDPSSGMATGSYANWMAQKVSLGIAGASALALAFGGAGFPGWTSAHKLSGISHALWDLRYDEKGEHFGAGVPEPAWTGRWVKVYDPRKDSTYPGGSGSHRALDESTYEWSRNPGLHALTWALGRWQNGKRTLGIGAPSATIRFADFVDCANVCDANLWHCGGVEYSTDSKWAILKRILQAGGAEPTMAGAMIGCRVNTPRVAIATVEAEHLLDGLSISTTRSRRDRFNAVIPRYRSEDHDWEVISGAPIVVPAYVAEDQGYQRTKEIDFPLVQHEVGQTDVDGNRQAGQLATYEIVNSREAGPIRFTVGPQFIGVKTGDVVNLNVPEEGLAAQPVLIRSRAIDPATLKITFEAETETTAKHDFALGKTATPPPPFSLTPPDLTPPTPDADLWTLYAGSTSDGVPGLFIEGVCEFPGADSVLIEYRLDSEPDWLTLPKSDASSPVRVSIAPVDGGASYRARLCYQSGSRVGDWLELGPTTAPDFLIGGLTLDQVADTLIDFNDDNDGNGLTPPAVTSVSLTGRNFTDGSGETTGTWSYTVSSDPAAANNIDGYLAGLMIRPSSAGYTYNPADNALIRWQTVPADQPYAKWGGTPVDQYCTLIVIPIRNVRSSVESDNVVRGPAAQSSSTTPFRQATAPRFDGYIDSVTTAAVADGTGRALVGLTPGGNVGTGKVLTGSVATDAINSTVFVPQGALITFGTSDAAGATIISGFSKIGVSLRTRFIFDQQIQIMDPNTGDQASITVKMTAKNLSSGITYTSGTFTVTQVWNTSSASGLKSFPRDSIGLEWTFDSLPSGFYDIGYEVTTDSRAGLRMDAYRYESAEDNRAKT